ncbi:MAG: hypothetical protein F4210_15125 [Holophagales bacterium]|nr:hypothetical protein [Holophagales bacterium]MYF96803.1 hypothetical protein [Holophagales bacterium]
MSPLLDNAIQSIRIGVEDYEAHDPARALSAIRNLHAGLLLLAKEVLVQAVPDADEDDLIGADYKPMPDGNGNVTYEKRSARTIGLAGIGERFKDFRIPVDQAALKKLSGLRNDVEHRYTQEAPDAVRQTVAGAFPLVVRWFRRVGVDPVEKLGEAWKTMLEVRDVYEQELRACRETFDGVEWAHAVVGQAPRECPRCRSELLEQIEPENREQECADSACRSCGAKVSAERLVENAVAAHYSAAELLDYKHGGDGIVFDCPECGLHTYVVDSEPEDGGSEFVGCVVCEHRVQGRCARCQEDLTPGNLGANHFGYCDYCEHMLLKDD